AHLELCFVEIALALLILDLCLDYIGMCHFSAFFEFLTDLEKMIRLENSFLGRAIFAPRDDMGVISLNHGDDQTSSSHFRPGLGESLCSAGAAIFGEDTGRKLLMDVSLRNVFMDGVVGDENRLVAVQAVALRIQVLHVVVHIGK